MKTNAEYTQDLFRVIARKAIDGDKDPKRSARIIANYAQMILEIQEEEARKGRVLSDCYPNLDSELI